MKSCNAIWKAIAMPAARTGAQPLAPNASATASTMVGSIDATISQLPEAESSPRKVERSG